MNNNGQSRRRTIPFTQAAINRAVKAAQKAGLHVKGINAATGEVVVHDPDKPMAIPTDLDENQPSKWDDVGL
jgi:flagellar basal body rod protein FlgC